LHPIDDFDLIQIELLVSFIFPRNPEIYTGRVKRVDRMVLFGQRRVTTVHVEYIGEDGDMKTVKRTAGLVTQIIERCPVCRGEVLANVCALCDMRKEIDRLEKKDAELKEKIKVFYEVEKEQQLNRDELFILNQQWRENRTELEQARNKHVERTG